MFGRKLDSSKFSLYTKQATGRIQIQANKTLNEVKIEKRKIIDLLRSQQYAKALIALESVIGKEYRIEALDIVHLMCDMLHARTAFMKSEKDIPSDMLRSVHTVIWAAKRATVPELPKIAELLRDKYGGDLIKHAKENKHGHVDEKVMQRLSMNPPSPTFKVQYIMALAGENDIDVDPNHPELRQFRNLILELTKPQSSASDAPPAPFSPPGPPGPPGHFPPGGGGGMPMPQPGAPHWPQPHGGGMRMPHGGGMPMPPMPHGGGMPMPYGGGPAHGPHSSSQDAGAGGMYPSQPPPYSAAPGAPATPGAWSAPPSGPPASTGGGGGLDLPMPPSSAPESTPPPAHGSAPTLEELTARFGALRNTGQPPKL